MNNEKLTTHDIRCTIIHECGHMLVLWFSEHIKFTKCHMFVYTKTKGGDKGVVDYSETSDETEEVLISRIAMRYGGYFAEREYGIPIDSGSRDDLEEATKIATKMVMEYGMSPHTKLQYFDEKTPIPKQMREVIQKGIEEILQRAQNQTKKMIQEHKKELDKLILAMDKKRQIKNTKELHMPDIEKILGPRPPTKVHEIKWPNEPTPTPASTPAQT